MYVPLMITTLDAPQIYPALEAMRLPLGSKSEGVHSDLTLATKLIKAGDDHAKFARGIIVYAILHTQAGFMVELDTYRIGTEVLSTSSTMHQQLRGMQGAALADAKQELLPTQYYKRIQMFSYQTLRRIHKQRRHHRHPDWAVFCDWIQSLPYAEQLILASP